MVGATGGTFGVWRVTIELIIDRVLDGRILGWGWDRAKPDQSLTVELWKGTTVISTARASHLRADVKKSGRGTGLYGFTLEIPQRVYANDGEFLIKVDGNSGVFSKVAGSGLLHEAVMRDLVEALVKKLEPRLLKANGVEFSVRRRAQDIDFGARIDGREVSARRVPAESGEDENVVLSVPRTLCDGGVHTVELLAGSAVLAMVSTTIPKFSPIFKGNVEGVRDGALTGWCMDELDPQTPARLEIYVDNQLRDIVVASRRRADLEKLTPGGAIGFSWPLPAELRDGRAHGVTVVPLFGDAPLGQAEPSFVFPWRSAPKLHRFSPAAVGMDVHADCYGVEDAGFAERLAGAAEMAEWQKSMPTLLRSLSRKPKVTVFVPVYNAAESVALCLRSLVRNTTYPCEFLLIDDASPQQEIQPLLDLHSRLPNFRVVRNPENIGYTKNCNQAIRLTDGDIVFLNSDTYVPPRWLERLVVAAYRRRDVATVTAISNHSGAFSVPEPYGANPTPSQITPEDYAILLSRVSGLNQPLVPTGNGFCMYVRREAIEDIGGFDEEAFPRGYGEENDFCMRALKAGWSNVIDDRSFVYHIRSASFGGQQPELQSNAQNTLAERHPDYTILTQTFSSDPAIVDMRDRAKRLVNWLKHPRAQARANKLSRPRILYVLHYNGEGGTALTTRDLVGLVADEFECFLLTTEKDVLALDYWRDGDWSRAASMKLDGPMDLIDAPRPDYEAAVATLLLSFDISLLHVRHLIGHSFYLPRIAHRLNIPVVMSHHDFYAVCPSVTLVDDTGAYCRGSCTPGFGDCPTMVPLPPEMQPLKHGYIGNWRERVEATFPYCDTFITTSDYVRELFYRVFPKLRQQHDFRVIEHGRDNAPQPSLASAPSAGEPFRVLLLGNVLHKHKGFGVARAIKALDSENDVEFHFLGAAPPDASAIGVAHGRYQRDELPEKIAGIRPNAVAIFSIWPETYCHTLSEAWQFGVPVIGSIYGAVGERINRHGGGWAVDCNDVAAVLGLIRKLKTNPAAWETARVSASARNLRSPYAMAVDYIEIYKQRLTARLIGNRTVRRVFLIEERPSAAWREPVSLLRSILRHPAVAPFVNLIDVNLERWRFDRFTMDSSSLAIVDDSSLTLKQLQDVREVAAGDGVNCVLMSDPAVHALLRYVDERNWLSLTRHSAPAKRRVGGRELANVVFVQSGAVWPHVSALSMLCQREMICMMKVIEASADRLAVDAEDAAEGLNETCFARQLAALTQNAALAVLPEPQSEWDRLLADRIGFLGLPVVVIPGAASLQEASALVAEQLKASHDIQQTADFALTAVGVQRNAEKIVSALGKFTTGRTTTAQTEAA